MDAITANPLPQPTKRHRFLPRFRTSTLLWFVVVVAAFFVGQQSDEIGSRLSKLWQNLWPSSASYQLMNQPDGSLLFITSKSKVTGMTYKGPPIVQATGLGTNQVKKAATEDGKTQINYWQYDKSTGNADIVTLDLVIKDGRITATPAIIRPPTKPAR